MSQLDTPQAEVIPPATPSGSQFCGRCGTPFANGPCRRCNETELNQDVEQHIRRDMSLLRQVMIIYGSILGLSVMTALAAWSLPADRAFEIELAASGAMVLISLACCIVNRRMLIPAITKRISLTWLAVPLVLAVGTYIIASYAVMLLGYFDLEMVYYSDAYRDQPYGLCWLVVTLAVIPAVTEEFTFRGIIQPALGHLMGPAVGLMVASMLFAILHLSVLSIPHLLLMGLTMGWLRNKTGSVIPGVILHFTHNLLVGLDEWFFWSVPWSSNMSL